MPMAFIYETKQFYCIGRSFSGVKNDIYICEDIYKEKYTLCIIKDHRLAKRLTEYFEAGKRPGHMEIFSAGGMYCIANPYRGERKLKNFIESQGISFENIKEICGKVVFECMSSRLPWPILYLVIKNEYINIDKNGNIYFTYRLNLEMFREKCEADCAALCAMYLEVFLEEVHQTSWSGYRLLKMKNRRMGYTTFSDLYLDIQAGTGIGKNKGLLIRIKNYIQRHKGKILLVIKAVCILVGITALIFLITNIIFGDNPLLRLFVNTFKKIGTESMLQ